MTKNVIELALVGHPWGNNLVRRVVMNKLVEGQVATVRKRLAIGVPQESDKMSLKIVKRGIEFTGYYKTKNGSTGSSDWIEAGRQAAPGFDRLYPTLKTANGYSKSYEATATFDNFVAIKNDIQRTVENESSSVAAYHTLFDDMETFQRDYDTSNASTTHYGLNGGLNIVSQSSAPIGQKPKPNIILLNKELPQGDYEIEVQASTRITSQNPDVGIALFDSPEKGLYFGHAAFGGGGYNHHPQFQFEKVLKGERTGGRVQMGLLGQ